MVQAPSLTNEDWVEIGHVNASHQKDTVTAYNADKQLAEPWISHCVAIYKATPGGLTLTEVLVFVYSKCASVAVLGLLQSQFHLIVDIKFSTADIFLTIQRN